MEKGGSFGIMHTARLAFKRFICLNSSVKDCHIYFCYSSGSAIVVVGLAFQESFKHLLQLLQLMHQSTQFMFYLAFDESYSKLYGYSIQKFNNFQNCSKIIR